MSVKTMNPKYLAFIVVTIVLALLTGCTTTRRPGFPRQSYDEKKQIKDLETRM